ncbi:MAG TPA: CGNR zinc finger domain-containing protein [Longimicrobium sp.]|nr:CGNR zinc finger domain-containing protein [Longimicrobium sp.]
MTETAGGTFAFLGGAPCLDFANTAFRENGVPVWDALEGFGDVLAWGVAAGLLAPVEGERLAAERDGADDGAAFAAAIALREQVYRVFAALAGGGTADPGELAALDAAQRDAFGHRRLVAEGRSFRWEWSGTPIDRVRWGVAESASELLTLGGLGRLRRCAGEDCTRLFVDTSRGGRRRWCDMSHCGNIAKVRRFRTRHPNGGPSR